MTGKEKIQAVIDIINEERQRIVAGNVVEISSATFASKGLNLDEQQQVLDLLADDKKWITYTFEYLSNRKVETIADRLKPDLIRLIPFAKESAQPFTYTIEVLDSFGEVSNQNKAVSSESQTEAEATQAPATVVEAERVAKPAVEKIILHKFVPQHYIERTGVLHISITHHVDIAKKGKVRRQTGKKKGQKYDQCWLLECIFKNVNSLKSGVSFSKFLGVNYNEKNKKDTRKIRNTVYEINKKVTLVGGPNNLIKIQKQTIFLNNSYL